MRRVFPPRGEELATLERLTLKHLTSPQRNQIFPQLQRCGAPLQQPTFAGEFASRRSATAQPPFPGAASATVTVLPCFTSASYRRSNLLSRLPIAHAFLALCRAPLLGSI